MKLWANKGKALPAMQRYDIEILTVLLVASAAYTLLQFSADEFRGWQGFKGPIIGASGLTGLLLWRAGPRPVGFRGWARFVAAKAATGMLFMGVVLSTFVFCDYALYQSWADTRHWLRYLDEAMSVPYLWLAPGALVLIGSTFQRERSDLEWSRRLVIAAVFLVIFAVLSTTEGYRTQHIPSCFSFPTHSEWMAVRSVVYLTAGLWLVLAVTVRLRIATQRVHLLPPLGLGSWLVVRGLTACFSVAIERGLIGYYSNSVPVHPAALNAYAWTTWVASGSALAVLVGLWIIHAVRTSSASVPARIWILPLLLVVMSPAFAPWGWDSHPLGDEQHDFQPLTRPKDFLFEQWREGPPSALLMPSGEVRLAEWRRTGVEAQQHSIYPPQTMFLSVDARATIGDLKRAAQHLRGFDLQLSWRSTDPNRASAAQQRWAFVAPRLQEHSGMHIRFEGQCPRPLDTYLHPRLRCDELRSLPIQDDMLIATWLESVIANGPEDEPVNYVVAAPTETLPTENVAGVVRWTDTPRLRYARTWIDLEYLLGIPLGILLAVFWLWGVCRRELQEARHIWTQTTDLQGPEAESKYPWWTPSHQMSRRIVKRNGGPYRLGGQALMVAAPNEARRSWWAFLRRLCWAQLASGRRWLLLVFGGVLLALLASFIKLGITGH